MKKAYLLVLAISLFVSCNTAKKGFSFPEDEIIENKMITDGIRPSRETGYNKARTESIQFGLDIYSIITNYYDDDSDDITITNHSEIVNFDDLKKHLENKYSLKLETKEYLFKDKANNTLNFLEVDIITNRKYQEIYKGPAHRSLLIEEIILNLLQPKFQNDYRDYSINYKHQINALIMKLNGVYLGNIGSDRQYPTIFQKGDAKSQVSYFLWAK
jgi:hypothetical protein